MYIINYNVNYISPSGNQVRYSYRPANPNAPLLLVQALTLSFETGPAKNQRAKESFIDVHSSPAFHESHSMIEPVAAMIPGLVNKRIGVLLRLGYFVSKHAIREV